MLGVFVFPPLDWPQVLNWIKVWKFPGQDTWSYHLRPTVRSSIMLEKALYITKLFLDGPGDGGFGSYLSGCFFYSFFFDGCVLRQNWMSEPTASAEKQHHTWMGSGRFYCWHGTKLGVYVRISNIIASCEYVTSGWPLEIAWKQSGNILCPDQITLIKSNLQPDLLTRRYNLSPGVM